VTRIRTTSQGLLAKFDRRGQGDAETLAELWRLRGEAERTGFRTAIPALDAALAEAKAPASVTLP
jgi:hypothetical protein